MAPFLVLDRFLNYLKIERRYSEHTLLAYRKDISQFFDFTCVSSSDELVNTSRIVLRSWIRNLNEENCSNKTIARKLSSLRSFSKFLKKELGKPIEHLSRISAPKVEKRLPSFAKEAELNVIIDFDESDFSDLRDRLIFELLYQTGIRLSELIELKEDDVSSQSIKVLGKRNKERIIPISASLRQMIKKYQILKENESLQHPCLFVLNNGRKLYPKFVYRKINNYLGKVTVMEKKSPHVLRHTFATHLLNNGAGLETLKELLGHANLSATQVYTHNSFAQLSNIFSQAHPRGRKTN